MTVLLYLTLFVRGGGGQGPLCELLLMAAGCWHYLSPICWPLAAVGFGPEQLPGSAWAGLLSLTAPCYSAEAGSPQTAFFLSKT